MAGSALIGTAGKRRRDEGPANATLRERTLEPEKMARSDFLPNGTTDGQSILSAEEQDNLLQLQQNILEAVARGTGHMPVIHQICLLEERLLPNSVGSVMLLDEKRELLNVYAAPTLPAEGIARLNGLRPGPEAGSCGNAVYWQEAQFVSNTITDPRWRGLRQIAFDFNLCSCWSVPIFSGTGEVVGSFALSSFEHREPSPFHRKMLDVAGSIIGIVLDRAKSQESLRLHERVFEGSEEGFVITDTNRKILFVNRAFSRISGYSKDEIYDKTPSLLSSGYHDDSFYEAMWESINKYGSWQGEIWNRRKNGEIYPEWLSISAVKDTNGTTTHYIGIFSDISEQKNAEATIQYLSTHDATTGLPNRILFKDLLENALAQAGHHKEKVALLNLNLDNFKILNDSLGHAAADTVLSTIAARLKSCVRDIDPLCRHGGDEFLCALIGIRDAEEVGTIILEILEGVAAPVAVEDRSLSLTGSIGAALYPEDGVDYETLLKCADKAMRHAKESGRNTYRFFTERLNTNSLEYLRIAQGLRDALRLDQLTLHYQPQISLGTGLVTGAEALIRWNHPSEGLIYPGRFIDIAEQTGIIVEIGDWVLQEACRQAMAWQREGFPPLVMAVNISAVQFRRGSVEPAVRAALGQSGLPPRCLEIELTESVLLNDTNGMLSLFNRLKELGVGLSIDDFGTGYSSLAYLKRFKIDRLKIDQSFIRDIGTDPNDAAIVQAIIQMAHILNLRTIAEGVEDETLLEHLRRSGCDEVQGYHLGRPLPAGEFLTKVLEPQAAREKA